MPEHDHGLLGDTLEQLLDGSAVKNKEFTFLVPGMGFTDSHFHIVGDPFHKKLLFLFQMLSICLYTSFMDMWPLKTVATVYSGHVEVTGNHCVLGVNDLDELRDRQHPVVLATLAGWGQSCA